MASDGESFPGGYPPAEIFILGAGRFGRIACERLHRRYDRASFLVIDSNPENLAKLEREYGLPVHLEEAIPYMLSNRVADDIWIVPAIPIHVAFEWIAKRLENKYPVQHLEVPAITDQQVPNPFRMNKETLYTSFATFRCPDFCSEPDEICTSTGKPRPGNLFEELQLVEIPGFAMTVIRSWQLAPGVGGYPAASLSQVLDSIRQASGNHLIATSCRCHGVINALKWHAG